MNIIFTEQALESLEEALNFIVSEVSHNKLISIRNDILNATDILKAKPYIGQKEIYLEHLG
jgi:plasmid stabilization system protein ParE